MKTIVHCGPKITLYSSVLKAEAVECHKLLCDTKPRRSRVDLSSGSPERLRAVLLCITHTTRTSASLLGIHSQLLQLMFIVASAVNSLLLLPCDGDRNSAVIHSRLMKCCAGMPSGVQERERSCTTKEKGSSVTTLENISVFC